MIALSGQHLKAARRVAGINQTDMGKRIGCSRHAISYWETKAAITSRQVHFGVPKRMCDVLGIEVLPIYLTNTRARGDGVLQADEFSYAVKGGGAADFSYTVEGGMIQFCHAIRDWQQEALDRECARINAKVALRAARYRQPCGAKTRKGKQCRNLSEAG